MAGEIDIGTLITRSPGIVGGRPRIAGTGVSVRRIAIYSNQGRTPEEISANFGYISVAQVYAALAYYHANREEMDADIAAEDAEYDKLARQFASNPPLRR